MLSLGHAKFREIVTASNTLSLRVAVTCKAWKQALLKWVSIKQPNFSVHVINNKAIIIKYQFFPTLVKTTNYIWIFFNYKDENIIIIYFLILFLNVLHKKLRKN